MSLARVGPDHALPRKVGKRAKPARKTSRVKKLASKPKTDRVNKKAEVIAMSYRVN